jgi:predicted HicB family RNase H-like nuclease
MFGGAARRFAQVAGGGTIYRMSTPERLEYKGYNGVYEYQPESFAGHVEGIRDEITFCGGSVDELRHEMATSVDIYLKWCEEKGLEPERPRAADRNPITMRALFHVLRQDAAGQWVFRRLIGRFTPPWLRRLFR